MGPCPFHLVVDPVARFLNAELVDHPVYDAIELQWFDDREHGTGLLAFLCRRDGRLVDYYPSPGLTLQAERYTLGGGTGAWTTTWFDEDILEVGSDGVLAQVRFADVDGRMIEVRVDDRDPARGTGSRGTMLAPVSAAIDQPGSLLLVWMHDFDLVHDTGTPPVIAIDGQPVDTGRLPGRRLHRRHLIKYAAPLTAVSVNPAGDGHGAGSSPGDVRREPGTGAIEAVLASAPGAHAELRFDPPLPDPAGLHLDDEVVTRWQVDVDGTVHVTGGVALAQRTDDRVTVTMEVTDRWRPGPLPPLLRTVTRIVPVFRRWPTTYRWVATIDLGPEPVVRARWERTSDRRAESYRRATGGT